jgi:homoserine O-acetyltransferase
MAAAAIPGDHMKDGWGAPASARVVTLPGPFVLDSGAVLPSVTLAFNTYGTLAADGANCAIVGHSLTSNSCVHEWWSALMGDGPAYALDTSRFFVVCVNYLGSVYGSDSPLTPNPATGERYGADFPLTSIRDNVRAQRALLAGLGVTRVALAIGGSLGGMLALEWAACYPDLVGQLVLIAAPAAHGGWAIGINEVERQAIYADHKWCDGRYDLRDPPTGGMAVARQLAMLTYRSPQSFDAKFGRASKPQPSPQPSPPASALAAQRSSEPVGASPRTADSDGGGSGSEHPVAAAAANAAAPHPHASGVPAPVTVPAMGHHTGSRGSLVPPSPAFTIAEGSPLPVGFGSLRHRLQGGASSGSAASLSSLARSPSNESFLLGAPASSPSAATPALPAPPALARGGSASALQQQFGIASAANRSPLPPSSSSSSSAYEVESYLRYQGAKFIRRFDPLCYVRLTQTLDSHDVGAGRGAAGAAAASSSSNNGKEGAGRAAIRDALGALTQRTFVVGIDSDLLYPVSSGLEGEGGREEAPAWSPLLGLRLLAARSPVRGGGGGGGGGPLST